MKPFILDGLILQLQVFMHRLCPVDARDVDSFDEFWLGHTAPKPRNGLECYSEHRQLFEANAHWRF